MNQELAEEFIRYFALKYFAHLFPPEVLAKFQEYTDAKVYPPEIAELLEAWDNKISIQAHWEGVIEDYQSEKDLAILSLFKQALFTQRQLQLEYVNGNKEVLEEGERSAARDDTQAVVFNPFGLVIRNENFFFVGSCGDNRDPVLLSINKVINAYLQENKALEQEIDFNLGVFAEQYLNHPVTPGVIEKLVVEFPNKTYFYVKSHPIRCEELTLTEPDESVGYFKLEAKNVPNNIRLHQWFSGFHDDAQILEPFYLRKLINRSYIDQLTNLYNRKAFERLGHREIELCFRHRLQIFSVLIIDIDHFKTINDRHGHIFGDDVLIKVSECLRDYDAIRYGGEEFVILLSNTTADACKKAAERIRHSIADLVLKNEFGKQVPVTISLGIAEFPRHLSEQDKKVFELQGKFKLSEKDKNGLMMAITEQADKALYLAKMNGRNQSVVFQDEEVPQPAV